MIKSHRNIYPYTQKLMLKLKLQYFGNFMWRVDSLERPWCWEGLRVGGEGNNRGWNGWMASPTWWAWVWVDSGSWWWTEQPGMLRFMRSKRVRHNWATELNTQKHESKNMHAGISLVVQRLNSALPLQGAQVPSLVRELKSHMLCRQK